MQFTTWKAWNDAYVSALKKRNKAQRDVDAAWRDANALERAKARLVKAEALVREVEAAERPDSGTMRNLIRA